MELGRQGGVAFIILAAAICNFTGASCLQAQARTCFALSRGQIPTRRSRCRG
jgi:amino acid transporter